MNNTRKHLDILYGITMVILILSALGASICLIAVITDENPLPLIFCTIIAICSYLSAVFISVIMDFYDAIVTKHKTSNATNADATKSQEQ